jgi:FG-GAP-like repeat/Dockerin type I domain
MNWRKRHVLGWPFVVIGIVGCGLVASGAYLKSARSGRAQMVNGTSSTATVNAAAAAYQLNLQAPTVNSVAGPQVGGAGMLTAVTGDFNGDGIPDFATAGFYCANPSGDAITVYLGDGHGGFQTPMIFPAGQCVANIAKGRVRGNGAPEDLVVVNAFYDGMGLAVLLGNGDGSFAAPILIPFPNTPAAAAIADVNGDGKADLIVVGATDGQTADSLNNIAVLFGHGDGTFDPPVFSQGFASLNNVQVADVNNDGKPDLILSTADEIAVAIGNGDGTFLPPYVVLEEPSTVLSVNPPGPIANGLVDFVLADFNGDGNLDIAAAEDGERVDVLLGTGTGSFLGPVTYLNTQHQTGFGGGHVATAKLTNSGHLDLVVTSGYGTTLGIFYGNGDGTFQTTPVVYPLPQFDDEALILADVNSDGLPDIVIGTAGARSITPNYLTILLNQGNGSFGPAPAEFSNVAVNNNTANPTNPIGLTLADLTGNGKLDLVTTNWGYPIETLTNGQIPVPPTVNPTAGTVDAHSTISVFPGNGDGTFGAEQQYEVGARPIAVQSADLTGDGKKDLVVVNAVENTVSLLKGNGDRTFQPAISVAVGQGPTSLALGDFNGDGKLDVAVTNVSDNTVSILLNQSTPGNLSLVVAGTYPVDLNPSGIVARDFNHDGKMDLAVVNAGDYTSPNGATTLSVLLGNGDGTFGGATTQVLWGGFYGSGGDGIAVGDFGNGQQDLAVANFSKGEVMVLKGHGDGTFESAGTYTAGDGTEGIVVADFNGDGKLDIAVNNLNDYTVTLLVGNGDGTFVSAAQKTDDRARPFGWASWGYPAFIAAGDLTGKGRPDIVLTHIFEQTASVLRNLTTGVPISRISSRGVSGGANAFDVDLTGGNGIECRSGGANANYTLVIRFVNPLTSVGGASVTSGVGSVASSQIDPNDSSQYIVNLTGVTNAQRITVSLTNVVDGQGNSSPVVSAAMGILIGDTNGDGLVNSADISQTKSQSGNSVSSSNFREDVNADGFLNSADISLVKSRSGTALP